MVFPPLVCALCVWYKHTGIYLCMCMEACFFFLCAHEYVVYACLCSLQSREVYVRHLPPLHCILSLTLQLAISARVWDLPCFHPFSAGIPVHTTIPSFYTGI